MSLRPIDDQIWLELRASRAVTQGDLDLLEHGFDAEAAARRDDRPPPWIAILFAWVAGLGLIALLWMGRLF